MKSAIRRGTAGIGDLWPARPAGRSSTNLGDLLTIAHMPRPFNPFRGMGDLLSVTAPVGTQIQGFGCAAAGCAGCAGCSRPGFGEIDTTNLMPTLKTAAIGAVAGIAMGLYLSRKKR